MQVGINTTGIRAADIRSAGLRSVGSALRLAESVLLAGGQQHARRNAWRAVCENRRYAADRERAAVGPVAGE